MSDTDVSIALLAEVRGLRDLVTSNANASLSAHHETRHVLQSLAEEVEDLRRRVDVGTSSRPPLASVAHDAHAKASNTALELAAVEGRTLAAVSELTTRVQSIDAKTDAQTEMLTSIVGALNNPMAKRVAKGVALLFIGWLASRGLHI